LINLETLRLDASAQRHLLPLCYHFLLEAPVYSFSRRQVNAGGSIGLHSWQNVTIEVEGYSDLCLPESIFARKQKRLAILSDSNPQQLPCLLNPMPAQLFNYERRKGHSAGTAGFSFLQTGCLAGLFSALDNSELPSVEIDVAPPERGYLRRAGRATPVHKGA